jgi:large subunit ribosomal protein L7e
LKKKRADWSAKAKSYYEKHRQQERDVISKRREARNKGNFYVPNEAKVALVIRLKGYIGFKLV